MDTLQLKYFQTVARYENISKAALELNISQPALSLTIKRLESDLGYPLFKRVGRNIYLNDFGRSFLDSANLILIELDNLKIKFEEINNIKNMKLSISSTSSLFLLGILNGFLDKNPDLKVVQTISNRSKIIEDLKYGKVDVAITSPPIKEKNIKTIKLMEEEIVVIVNKNNKLAKKESIYLKDLKDENFMELTHNYSFVETLAEFYQSSNFVPNIIFQGDINIIKELINSDKGITIAPISLLKTFDLSKTKYLKLKDKDSKRTIALSYPNLTYKSEVLKEFIKFTKEHFSS